MNLNSDITNVKRVKTCRTYKDKRNRRIQEHLNREIPEGHRMCNRKNGHIILPLEDFGWCEKTGDWHKMCLPCRKIVNEKDKARTAKWHLDHFIPCHSFDLRDEENRQKCFNWRNLQWMPAKDNISKI